MKTKTRPNDIRLRSRNYSLMPLITTVTFHLLFGREKETESSQEKKPETKPNSKRLAVDKYEFTDNIVKFFIAKGFLKKRWVALKEIPINEITNVESYGNELNITCNNAVHFFVLKKKSELFSSLSEQIRVLLEERSRTAVGSEKADQRKRDLTVLVDTSIGSIDILFDIFISLNGKRVNWARLESYLDSTANNLNIDEKTLIPLTWNFAKVSDSINRQLPKETSKEAYNVLKMIYGYFDTLETDDSPRDAALNIQKVKAVILSYFILNDLMLGKVIGEKDDQEEIFELEDVLFSLNKDSTAMVNFAAIKTNLDKLDFEAENNNLVEDTRTIFKENLKQFLKSEAF